MFMSLDAGMFGTRTQIAERAPGAQLSISYASGVASSAAQIGAAGGSDRVVDARRIERDEHREIGERLGARGVVKRQQHARRGRGRGVLVHERVGRRTVRYARVTGVKRAPGRE